MRGLTDQGSAIKLVLVIVLVGIICIGIYLATVSIIPSAWISGVGGVAFSPPTSSVTFGDNVDVKVRVNSGISKLGAYQFTITYDESVVDLDTGRGTNGVEAGSDGFVSSVDVSSPGRAVVSGSRAGGAGPGGNLHILTLHWKTTGTGTAVLGLGIDSLTDPEGKTIGNPENTGGEVRVTMAGVQEAGDVWFSPPESSVDAGEDFGVEVHVNTENSKLGSYEFIVTYSPAVIDLDTDMGLNGIEAGDDGFVSSVDVHFPGQVIASGSDIYGTGPGEDIHVLTVHLIAKSAGTTALGLNVTRLTDAGGVTIGTPYGINGWVTVG